MGYVAFETALGKQLHFDEYWLKFPGVESFIEALRNRDFVSTAEESLIDSYYPVPRVFFMFLVYALYGEMHNASAILKLDRREHNLAVGEEQRMGRPQIFTFFDYSNYAYSKLLKQQHPEAEYFLDHHELLLLEPGAITELVGQIVLGSLYFHFAKVFKQNYYSQAFMPFDVRPIEYAFLYHRQKDLAA